VSVWIVRRQLERLDYTSTLPRGTPILTQQHKTRVFNGQSSIKMMTGVEQYLPMKRATNCFVIQFDVGR